MKGITETEYYCRVRKILKSKLNGGNVIAAINLRAVSVVRQGTEIMTGPRMNLRKWTELKRHHVPKLLTIYRSPLGRSYNRLYVIRKERGRGL